MPITPIPLADQSNPGRYSQDGAGRLINCFVEPRSKEGRHPTPVYPVEGLSPFIDLPVSATEQEGLLILEDGSGNYLDETGLLNIELEGDPFAGAGVEADGVQQILTDNGYLWVITRNRVFKVSNSGSYTQIGNIAGSGYITADVNRDNQLAIANNGNFYIVSTSLDTITKVGAGSNQVDSGADVGDQTFYSPSSTCHYNGYFVVTYPNGRWQISALNNGLEWDDADLISFIFRGDDPVRCLTRGGDLVLFGTHSIEFWQDVASATGTPFSRVSALEIGIGPPLSAINIDEAVLFVDNDLSVRQLNGYQTVTVSTPFIARKIRQASDPDSIRATAYERDGHKFYSISCSDFTLTYNLATQLWHEERSKGLNRRVINAIAKLENVTYAGNYNSGQLYTMSPDIYGEGTDTLTMEMHTPPVHVFPNRLRVKSLYIDAVFGQGLPEDVNADEADPKILVYVSEDSGENWVFLEELSLGDINSKYEELRVQGVGTSDQNGFTFRLVISTPVVRGILGMAADMTMVRA